MKLKKQIVLYLVVCALGWNCLGCGIGNHEAAQKNESQEHEWKLWERNEEMVSSQKAISGDNYYVIGKSWRQMPTTIPAVYAVEVDYQLPTRSLGTKAEGGYVPQTKMDEFYFTVYSLETGEKIKKIDIKEILQEKHSNLQVQSSNFFAVSYRGKPCIGFVLAEYPQTYEEGLEDTRQYAYLDVETEKLYLKELTNGIIYSPMERKTAIFRERYYNFLEINGLKNVSASGIKNITVSGMKNWSGCCIISMPITSLPEKNQQLYKMFPDLAKISEEAKLQDWENEDEIPYIDIYLVDDPTEEKLIRLLIPDGQEINFEGMKISDINSIDGQDHEISSFEEYQQYLKPYEIKDESELYPIFRSGEWKN